MDETGGLFDPTRRGGRMMYRIRNYFLTGLVIAAPLFLTIYFTWNFIQWLDSFVEPLIPSIYRPDSYLPFAIPGFGLLVALVFITLLGFLTANLVGRRLVHFGESLLDRMPLVRNVYRALKQMFETVVSSRAKTFQRVALMQFPRAGIWSIVFIVTDTGGEVREKLKDEDDDIVSVFIPTTPTPLTGYLIFAKASELVMLDMSIEDAAKMVVSAGLVSPEYQAMTAELAATTRKKKGPREVEPVSPPSAA
jgi:uncharacterized membrane protein